MAVECTQEAILDFVKERGGKVKNTDLIEHFKTVFPEEPGEKATVRKNFKNYVDNVAFVKSESGVKYVCLKKKFRGEGKEQSLKTETEPEPDFHEEKVRYPGVSQRAGSGESRAGDDVGQESALPRAPLPRDEPSPGSGYGNDSQVRVPHAFPAAPISQQKAGEKSHEFVCVVEDSCPGEMGNRQSFRRDKRESRRGHGGKGPDIPDIAVIEASPLPKEGSAFTLPEAATTGTTGQVAAAGLSPTEPDGPKEAEISPQRRYVFIYLFVFFKETWPKLAKEKVTNNHNAITL
ncbi:ankyrin repeat domain-containing protein SOWAHA-like [Plectropomus leopardus]|uniref:ankyrin repeat domain-containing protein SOWAHA-like n=1 Tax=Plectropomus leopardus TaxID=160734 RepID=UPI001C4B5A30|nr:ankyrin repeat domain-containing protein SOWAHA-like [Plectropomus leopardus]